METETKAGRQVRHDRSLTKTAAEKPMFLPAGPERIFAILSRPEGEATGLGVISIHTRNNENTAHRNRLGVRMTRALAARGVHGLRFDLHGTGDSTGILAPGVDGQPAADVLAAVDCLRQHGASRIALIGACYSAMLALAVAPQIPDLAGLHLVSPPIASLRREGGVNTYHAPLRQVLRHSMSRRSLRLLASEPRYAAWLAGRARERLRRTLSARSTAPEPASALQAPPDRALRVLRDLAERRVQLRLLFGENDPVLADLQAARTGPLGHWLNSLEQTLEIVVAPGGGHVLFTSLAGQDFCVDSVLAWVDAMLHSDRR
jgi:pimeloyl-ACP methyl ester carboxylesterase